MSPSSSELSSSYEMWSSATMKSSSDSCEPESTERGESGRTASDACSMDDPWLRFGVRVGVRAKVELIYVIRCEGARTGSDEIAELRAERASKRRIYRPTPLESWIRPKPWSGGEQVHHSLRSPYRPASSVLIASSVRPGQG